MTSLFTAQTQFALAQWQAQHNYPNATPTNPGSPGAADALSYAELGQLAADITWAGGQTIGNLVVADPGSTETIDLFNGSSASTDLVIDVEGYYTG